MSELGIIDELLFNDTLLSLSTGRQCALDCLWCAPALNAAAERWEGQTRKAEGPPTFERLVGNAFGASYDPAHFAQWLLHERTPICWSHRVEPWQAVRQALAIFDVIDRFDLPVFVQTRGLNWRKVWDQLSRRADQTCLYVSMGTADPVALARYEPSAPLPADRWALVEAAAAAGIRTMLAIAPAHPEWSPGGWVPMVERAATAGAGAIFFDPLHLNQRQLMAATGPDLARLASTAWGDETAAMASDAAAACEALGLAWRTVAWQAPLHGLESYDPHPGGWPAYRDARDFPYVRDNLFDLLHALTAGPDAPPLVVTWEAALAAMEAGSAPIAQRFTWGPVRDPIRALKELPRAWQDRLKPSATMGEFAGALWANPTANGALWSHPFSRLAMRPDGKPHVGPSGHHPVMLFGPYQEGKRREVVVPDLDAFDELAIESADVPAEV
jgi:hypothetical protein